MLQTISFMVYMIGGGGGKILDFLPAFCVAPRVEVSIPYDKVWTNSY